jgi:hypothetical protein
MGKSAGRAKRVPRVRRVFFYLPDGSFEMLNAFQGMAAAEVKEMERFVLIFVINA